ncbi:bifunctional metallophosphatase/5'-nucleotidase [Desulforegula conservatrix]|uniref:bifunctional metallophosphatase/5'-nucleotidase n=1 Tax=Desulforegula conservatrix TaxID=153026 RepID=UPI00040A5C55|nr:5'-nucleotidase C-terminal domain-containing protein [Desulforegula conservatrix]
MQRKKTANILLVVFTISSLFFSGCAFFQSKSQPQNFKLTIMHMNDTHSHLEPTNTTLKFEGVQTYADLGGFAKVASKIKEVRKSRPDSLLLHAGDAVQGSFYFTKYSGQPEYEMLSMLKVDAMEPGNHEFDRGPGFLADVSKYIDFSIVSSNIDASGDEKLKKIIKPYVIKEVAGQKIGIFGLITPETAVNSNPGKILKFGDEKQAAERTVKELEKAGVNKIVAITHLGYNQDIELAKAVSGIDVIVGGHSHTLLGDFSAVGLNSEGAYPTAITNKAGEKVFIVQSWEWAKAVGVVDVEFDDSGHAVKASGSANIILADNFKQKDKDGKKVDVSPETKASILKQIEENPSIEILADDPEAVAKLAPYKAGVEAMQKLVVVKIAEPLLHIRKPGKHSSGADLPGGSQVAPVICESMLWKANKSSLKAQIAILNGGGIRMDIPEGDLTVAGVNELLPFQNKLILLELTGKEVKTAIETGLADADGSGGGFTYVAGMRYSADSSKPAWQRLVKAEYKNDSGKWILLNDSAKYRIITNSYLSGGGNGYDVFKNSKGYRYDTGFSDAEAFMEYAKQADTIHRPIDTEVTMR